MSGRNLILMFLVMAACAMCRWRTGASPNSRYVADAYREIEDAALNPPPHRELVSGAMRGMMSVLQERGDPHSRYISRVQAEPFMQEMEQEFGGIGVRIRLLGEPPKLYLVGIPEPASPAHRAGVRPNDHVLRIDGEPVDGMNLQEIVDRMRGHVGEPIELTVLHQGDESPVELRMTRDIINVASVIGDRRADNGDWQFLLEEDPRIAYVRLMNFGNKTERELRSLLRSLGSSSAEALVLDLRENAGGALDAAVGVSDLFLPAEAPIVETRGRRQVVEEAYESTGEGFVLTPPVVVLVNRNSASASEIVAACLQDNRRASVGGERSFGKGTVQRIIPMEAGRSYLKLTTSSYWRPSGKDINRGPKATESDQWGVSPDAELRVDQSDAEHEQFLKWRAARDLTVFDAETGEMLAPPPAELLEEEPKVDDYTDRALLKAVEHLQMQLDAGA